MYDDYGQDDPDDKFDLVQTKLVSIDLFLLRKKDGKRLELTRNDNREKLNSNFGNHHLDLESVYYNDGTGEVNESFAAICDDGLWRWDLPACPEPNLELAKAVRFEATLHYKDRNKREQMPSNTTEEELETWLDNFKHDYDLLLSSFEVSLADTSHPEEWEYENVDDPEYYPRPTYRNNDVDDLLATVCGPGWSQRWM
jgi:hypothetical protein